MSALRQLKQWICRHEFDLAQMGRRNAAGLLRWPCHKCRKVFEMEYGLQAPGRIVQAASNGGSKP